MKVALFATCLVDTVVPQVAMATARLLERLGHPVTPEERTGIIEAIFKNGALKRVVQGEDEGTLVHA